MKYAVQVVVIGVSTKKEKGWVKFFPANGKWQWEDMGAHFDKSIYSTKFPSPGLYTLDLKLVSNFGERTRYEVDGVKFTGAFTDWFGN